MADATVDVPALGHVKKQWLMVGGALMLGIVGYAYLRRRSASTGTVTDTTGSDPNAFQGSALPGGSFDAYGNLASSNQGTVTQPDSWGLQAVNYLVTIFGYDRQAAGLAVSKYLNGEGITQAQADMVGIARSVIGNSPDNLAVKLIPTPTNPGTTTTPTDTTTLPDYTDVSKYWDAWQNQQHATGAYHGDPAGGLDWGELARNTFGASANPTRSDVYNRALQLQSLNQDAARRYMTYVPQNVIPTLRTS